MTSPELKRVMDTTCCEVGVAAEVAPLFLSQAPPVLLQRSSYRQYIQESLREGYPWKPDIFRVENEGKSYIVKDYAAKSWVFRVCVGAISIRREALAYRRLLGVQGIPQRAFRVDRYAIAVAHIPGRNAAQLQPGELTPDFFKQLREIIDRVHEQEIVLCDLRNIKNILLGDDGKPYLIDFSTAFRKGARWNVLKNGLYHLFFQDDLLGIAKLKKHGAPHLLLKAERLALEKGVFLQKPTVFIKLKGRAILRWIFGWDNRWRKNGKH